MRAPLPTNEGMRLNALRRYNILDTLPEQCFDDISHLAAEICGTPIALISFVDSERQWFKAKIGFAASESPRDIALCAHTILEPDLMVVPDARADHRFADNPLVISGPTLRFYAGAPLVTDNGEALGTLCVIDQVQRTLSEAQANALRALSRQVMAQLELRVHVAQEKQRQAQLVAYQCQLEAANRRLQRASLTDDVTGYGNTRLLYQELDRLTDETTLQPVSLIFFDMDKFKSVVDTHGHLLGAKVLREVAEVIDLELGPADRIVRYGGDEFVVILPEQSAEQALPKAERLQRRLAATPFLQEEELNLRVTASFGVATFPDQAGSKRQLLAQADRSLFHSKATGRNRVTNAATLG